MDPRILRHNELLSVLSEQPFGSQQDVVQVMNARGFDVTQSSISRDFRELGVAKIAGRYQPSEQVNGSLQAPLGISRHILTAQAAGPNLLVVRTGNGAANMVAEEIDSRGMPGVVGTVAGDNTIFVATKSKRAQEHFIHSLRKL